MRSDKKYALTILFTYIINNAENSELQISNRR